LGFSQLASLRAFVNNGGLFETFHGLARNLLAYDLFIVYIPQTNTMLKFIPNNFLALKNSRVESGRTRA